MTTTITTTQRLTVVKHLASGKNPDVVATITHLDRSTVVDIGAHHGYPDRDKLSWAADILAKKVEDETTKQLMPHGQPDPVRPAINRATTGAPSPTAAPTPLTKPDEIRILLNAAKAHPAKRIQNAANKVFDDLAKLRTLIAEDDEKNAERRKAEADKATARAEVERLKQELAAAQAKLRGTTATPAPSSQSPADGPTAKEIRAWAAESGVDCPAIGRVPASVRDAYDLAHVQAAS